jgi:capsular polysaccharide biosynthesis protein
VASKARTDVAPATRTAGGAATAAARPARTPEPEPPARSSAVIARRRSRVWLWLIALPLLGAALFGGGALAVGATSSPTYTADALVAVLPDDPADEVSIPVAGIWTEVGSSDAVLLQAAGSLDVSGETLASAVTLTQAPNAPVITVSATTDDADRSADWANAVAAQLLAEDQRSPVPGYGLRQVADAVAPAEGVALVTPLIVAAAAVVGAVVGLVVAQGLVRRRRSRSAGR